VARKFALTYPVALLARKPANYEPIVKEIEAAGGRAIGISTDVADAVSVKNAFEKIEKEMGGAPLAAAVFNIGGTFVRKPFLELTEEEFMTGMDANGYGQRCALDWPEETAKYLHPTVRVVSSSPEPLYLCSSKQPTSNTLLP
jgi:NADP-dependent 3-hydroxy acid dehydrogenase YdfG